MTNTNSHLDALNLRLSHERVRLENSKSERERTARAAWVAGIEKEIAAEKRFLGLPEIEPEMTDDELFAELGGLEQKNGPQ